MIKIKTGREEFDNLYPLIKNFLLQDHLDLVIDGQKIHGYRTPDAMSIWIRDYCDMMRGFKYFEQDLTSVVDHFAQNQADNGRIFDYFTTFPEKLPSERENWTKYVRVPVEADVEFRFVKAIFQAWQATGDDAWVERLLPKMERALDYIMTHPWRWDEGTGLVKRAYTIDTWDFAYTAGKYHWLQFQINEETFWGIMHGDNSGYYEAFRIMAFFHHHFRHDDQTILWSQRADDLKAALNRVCWNGKFYTHFVKLNPCVIPGVDESQQLSLSNPMDINRGTTDQEMAASIIREYQLRRQQTEAFAEWFSIDPPFPAGIFGDDLIKEGAYSNGGIMPLVGGELAKAAFDHGFEEYGADILRRYYQMISEKGETYLWYFPDGTPPTIETSTSPDAQPTDAWGSSAMLYALVEGLAGVQDLSARLQQVRLCPSWTGVGLKEAEVTVGYEASQATLSYHYRETENQVFLRVESQARQLNCQLLIPTGQQVNSVTVDGQSSDYRIIKKEQNQYAEVVVREGNAELVLNTTCIATEN